jgi:RNA recognition motif-containing protein
MDIFVGNLSFDTTAAGLTALFTPFGEVKSVKIVTDKFTGRSRGFAFVDMADTQAGQAAIAALHDTEVDGRSIAVNEARQKEEPSGDRFFEKRSKRNY